jgi:SAM-dependent methyltransferase
MHVVEHVGLGRYGDPLDPEGDLKAMRELTRVLAPGGTLLFVVPVGRPKIVFNAHRIYSYEQVLNCFQGLTLRNFFLIPDNALEDGPMPSATKEDADKQAYGCGCFWFTKPL